MSPPTPPAGRSAGSSRAPPPDPSAPPPGTTSWGCFRLHPHAVHQPPAQAYIAQRRGPELVLRPHVPGQALAQLQRRPRPGLGHAQPRAPVARQRVEPDRLHPHPRPAGRKAAPSGGLAHVQPVGGRQRGALEARFSQRTQGRIRNRLSPSTRCSWRPRWSASQPMQVSRAASARAAAAKPSAPTTLLPKPLSTALPPSYRKSRIARENAPSYRRNNPGNPRWNTPAPNTREQLLAARIRAPTEADVAGGLAPSLPTRPICLGPDGTDDRDTLAESYHPAPVVGPAVRRQPLKARAVCPTGHARILYGGRRVTGGPTVTGSHGWATARGHPAEILW